MRILVINGDCIQTNTSANLCHLAYIRGILDAGHEVTLLSADGRDYKLDESMVIPEQVKQHTYYGVSFYEKLSLRKRAAAPAAAVTPVPVAAAAVPAPTAEETPAPTVPAAALAALTAPIDKIVNKTNPINKSLLNFNYFPHINYFFLIRE